MGEVTVEGGVGTKEERKSFTEFLREHEVQSSRDIEKLFPNMNEKLKQRNRFVNALLKAFGPARVEAYVGGARLDLYETLASTFGSMVLLNDKTIDMTADYLTLSPSNYNLVREEPSSQFGCRFGDKILSLYVKKYADADIRAKLKDQWSIYILGKDHKVEISPPELKENHEEFEKALYIVEQHLKELGIGYITRFKYKRAMSKFN